MAYCDNTALSRPMRYTRKLGMLIGCAAWVMRFVSLGRGGAARVQKLILIRENIRKWRLEPPGPDPALIILMHCPCALGERTNKMRPNRKDRKSVVSGESVSVRENLGVRGL